MVRFPEVLNSRLEKFSTSIENINLKTNYNKSVYAYFTGLVQYSTICLLKESN